MELRQLRYFVKIADLGSLSKASRALHVAQPALSQQMAQLEAELGQLLLVRMSTGVRMTEQGEIFYTHAQRVLRQIEDIRSAIGSLEKSPSGTVSIGLPQTTATQYGLPLIEATAQRFPAIRLELFDEINGHIPQRLDSGRFDIGVIVNDDDAAMLQSTPLMDEHLFLVSRADQSRGLLSATAADIARLPLSVPGPGLGIRPMLDAFLARGGVTLQEPMVWTNSMSMMRRAMLSGLGHTIMPWGAVAQELAAGTLKATPLTPLLTRRVYVCTARSGTLSLAAQAVHTLLLAIVRQSVADGQWQGVTLLPE